MIRTGTTTINDMYFMTDDIIKAAIDTKIRLQTTRTLMNAGGNQEGDNRIEELKELLNKYNNKYENITFNVGIHGLYTTTREYVKKCIALAKEENLLVHMHFCENTKEVEDIRNEYNEIPIDILEKELRDVKTLLAHSVKLDDNDIERLSKLKDISVSHCPVSNLKLGCGTAKIAKMIESGINVSLGTDGQGSGSNLDLFEAMKFAALLQKGNEENAMLMPAYEVLKIATINGAKALGLNDKIGSVEEGKLADIIILDLDTIVTKPVNDVFSDIVYNVKSNNVVTTIVNGNILMEDKKIYLNEKEIYSKCKEIIERIKS